jgi:hypothetical protein
MVDGLIESSDEKNAISVCGDCFTGDGGVGVRTRVAAYEISLTFRIVYFLFMLLM